MRDAQTTQRVALLWPDSTPPDGAACLFAPNSTPPGVPALPEGVQQVATHVVAQGARLLSLMGRAILFAAVGVGELGLGAGRGLLRLRCRAFARGASRRFLTLTLAVGLAIIPGSLLLAIAALLWQRIATTAPLAARPPTPRAMASVSKPQPSHSPSATETIRIASKVEAPREAPSPKPSPGPSAADLDRAIATLRPGSPVELTPEAQAPSCSANTRSKGPLLRPSALDDKGPGYALLYPHRHLAYGTDALVGAIKRVALQLSGTGAPPLMVGNLSGARGSQAGHDPFHPAAYSSSHGAGRAVDLAFPVRDALGRPTKAVETRLDFDAEGRSAAGIRRLYLDATAKVPPGCRRNRIRAGIAELTCLSPEGAFGIDFDRGWKLIRELLLDPQIGVVDPETGVARPDGTGVRFLFVAPSIKQKLLAAASRAGESERMLQIARQLLHQPSNASAFSRFLHLELWCSAEDRAACGCDDGRPPWTRWRAGARVLPSPSGASVPGAAGEHRAGGA